MLKADKKISVIIPVYNEESLIYSNLDETATVLKGAFSHNYEIIAVDDGSSDHTYREIAKAASKLNKVKAVKLDTHQGKGAALKYGFHFATGDLVAFLDADLDLHPRQLVSFYDIMEKTRCDIVIGSKRHPESVFDYPKRRRVLSFFYQLLIFILFGLPVSDTQVGLKLFKYEVLKKVFPKLLIKAFAFDLELLANAHRLGYQVVEAPITRSFDRETRWGNIGFRDIRNMLIDTLAIFYRMYILKYYDKH